MALITKKITLDITPGAIPQVVHVSQYDIGREYSIILMDDGGVVTLPTDTTAKVVGSIGANAFSEDAEITGNVITFELTEAMTAKAGRVWAKIELSKNNAPIQTCAFYLDVDRAGVEAKTIINAPGFQGQVQEGVAAYLELHPVGIVGTLQEDGTLYVEDMSLVADFDSEVF